MLALLVLLLIIAVFGGLGFAVHWLWFVLIAASVIWAIAFLCRRREIRSRPVRLTFKLRLGGA
jgi:uncharacterized membrane protein YecN with MAPEG domain